MSSSFSEYQLTEAGGRLYFGGRDDVHGSELWVTDGTPAGTHLVADIRLGVNSSWPETMIELDGQLFFMAHQDDGRRKLWRANQDGATLVADFGPRFDWGPGAMNQGLVAFEGSAYFAGVEPIGVGPGGVIYQGGLYRTNGSGATRLPAHISFSASVHGSVVAHERLYFFASETSDPNHPLGGLWRTSGGAPSFVAGTEGSVQGLYSSGDSVFFNKTGSQLW
jgi:ELWxxDGT repeat protein